VCQNRSPKTQLLIQYMRLILSNRSLVMGRLLLIYVDARGISATYPKNNFVSELCLLSLRSDRRLIMDITRFSVAIEGFHHFKVVDCVGIHELGAISQ
jgi:hypothetical protein